MEQAIADVLAAAHAAGEFAHDDLAELPRAIHAAYNGAMVTWGMHGEGGPSDQVRIQLGILLGPYLAPTPHAR